jgi:hypothetical protein
MDINVTEALPNAFGGADIFGRRRPAGRTGTSISSNETTMTRTPLLIPRGRTFNGTTTASETTIVGPRPHSESQVGLAPLTIGVKVGEGLRAAGHESPRSAGL